MVQTLSGLHRRSLQVLAAWGVGSLLILAGCDGPTATPTATETMTPIYTATHTRTPVTPVVPSYCFFEVPGGALCWGTMLTDTRAWRDAAMTQLGPTIPKGVTVVIDGIVSGGRVHVREWGWVFHTEGLCLGDWTDIREWRFGVGKLAVWPCEPACFVVPTYHYDTPDPPTATPWATPTGEAWDLAFTVGYSNIRAYPCVTDPNRCYVVQTVPSDFPVYLVGGLVYNDGYRWRELADSTDANPHWIALGQTGGEDYVTYAED